MRNRVCRMGINMKKWMIFGGTEEGRLLAEFCDRQQIPCYVSVATDYGAQLLPKSSVLSVVEHRMNGQEMKTFFETNKIAAVVDATHPFATEVTENIKWACGQMGISRYRVLREQPVKVETATYVDNMDQAVAYLEQKTDGGMILVTTGSKEAYKLCTSPALMQRCILRILDVPQMVENCEKLGFSPKQILAGKGPFSREENINQMRQFDVRYLLTKESGKTGGFPEKMEAAQVCGVHPVVIVRPVEQGISLEEMENLLRNQT